MNERVAIVGLGYVGLPVALAFARKFENTVGFDISETRVTSLAHNHDWTGEVTRDELVQSTVKLTSDPADLRGCTFFIVAVPTPIDLDRRPDLGPLLAATRVVGSALAPGGLVVYESTVYPGVTEEQCGPLLAETSGLRQSRDFKLGYSPERINPGDKLHTFDKIIKVVSGEDAETLDRVARAYQSVVDAGVHRAPSIKVAEAAKVIENTQRDLNIALINELALIFARMGLDTEEVLVAAGTKWNFLPFRPGLVGGHCIGVDPYYLTHKAQEIGYHPEIILAGRRINDRMGEHIADRLVKLMTRTGINMVGARVLVMGLAFKENCPDIRNTKVIEVVRALEDYNARVDVYDPWVSAEEAMEEYAINPIAQPEADSYDAIVLAVAHREFVAMGAEQIRSLAREKHVLFDVKNTLPKSAVTARL